MNVLVIGKGKTGTTVISKTIQKSIEDADYLLEPKFIAEMEEERFREQDSSIVVKIIYEHWSKRPRMLNAIVYNECILKFNKIVTIVRDPRDELVSRMLYIIYPYVQQNGYDEARISKWLELLKEKEASPTTVSFKKMVQEMEVLFDVNIINNHRRQDSNYHSYVKTHQDRFHTLKYEDFISSRLEGLESYLGLKLTDDRDVGDLSRTKRSAAFNNWKEIFTKEDIEFIKRQLGDMVEKYGYGNDWEIEEKASLNPENYSDYVMRLLKKG